MEWQQKRVTDLMWADTNWSKQSDCWEQSERAHSSRTEHWRKTASRAPVAMETKSCSRFVLSSVNMFLVCVCVCVPRCVAGCMGISELSQPKHHLSFQSSSSPPHQRPVTAGGGREKTSVSFVEHRQQHLKRYPVEIVQPQTMFLKK